MTNGFANNFTVQPAGENAFILYSNKSELAEQNRAVVALSRQLDNSELPWLVELIPSYASLLIVYDFIQTDSFAVKAYLSQLTLNQVGTGSANNRIEIPVCYGYGELNDLPEIAELTGLTIDQVIKRHSEQVYRVYAIGFAPGFAYLGELDRKLILPRRATPRKRVFAGAVAIAEKQTAVYPSESPGGWHILGACPLTLFDVNSQPHLPFENGDSVIFRAIDEQEFRKCKAADSGARNHEN